MTNTLYMKTVMTVIALSLSIIAIKLSLGPNPANAVGEGCGTQANPCFVAGTVRVSRVDQVVDVFAKYPLDVRMK